MFYLISGGSGSGKSEYAELVTTILAGKSPENLIYIATMMAFDEEAEQKIQRHREMRKQKMFQTVECFVGLKNLKLPENSTILLDCMSNLAANEMFSQDGSREKAVEEIKTGIQTLISQGKHLVVVTNEIFSDGCDYEEETLTYIYNLGQINQFLAAKADAVVEVVCGIPVYYKGKEHVI